MKEIVDMIRNLIEFHNIPIPNATYEEVNDLFFNKIGEIPDLILERKDVRSQRIFRGTRDDIVDENQAEVKMFFSPPKEKAQLERANYPGFPVLYACNNPVIPFRELKPSHNSYMYLSEWSLKKPVDFRMAAFIINYNGNLKEFKEIKDWLINQIYNNIAVDKSVFSPEYVEMFQRVITEWFLGNNTELSAFLAHRYLYDKQMADMIIYPSIEAYRTHINFAIHPSFALEYFELKYVLKIQVREPDERGLNIAPIDSMLGTVDEDNMIKWNTGGYAYWEELTKELPSVTENI